MFSGGFFFSQGVSALAKSERVSEVEIMEEVLFDPAELLDEDLSSLPEPTEILGTWRFQLARGFVQGGVSAKGPWSAINLNLIPIEPVGEDASDVLSEANMDDLPRVRHRVFYSTNRDKRDFVSLMRKFGVAEGTLREMLEQARGEYIVATAKAGTDNRGMPETKLSNFRSAAASV